MWCDSFSVTLLIVGVSNYAGERSAISRGNFALPSMNSYRARVTISCPDRGETAGKLVLLPQSLQELLDIGSRKFGCKFTKITTVEGAEVEDIDLIRDGDHLVLVPDNPSNALPKGTEVDSRGKD